MESHLFLPELPIAHEPTGLALTRPAGTLSRPTGEGRGEGRFMDSPPWPRYGPSRKMVAALATAGSIRPPV